MLIAVACVLDQFLLGLLEALGLALAGFRQWALGLGDLSSVRRRRSAECARLNPAASALPALALSRSGIGDCGPTLSGVDTQRRCHATRAQISRLAPACRASSG